MRAVDINIVFSLLLKMTLVRAAIHWGYKQPPIKESNIILVPVFKCREKGLPFIEAQIGNSSHRYAGFEEFRVVFSFSKCKILNVNHLHCSRLLVVCSNSTIDNINYQSSTRRIRFLRLLVRSSLVSIAVFVCQNSCSNRVVCSNTITSST